MLSELVSCCMLSIKHSCSFCMLCITLEHSFRLGYCLTPSALVLIAGTVWINVVIVSSPLGQAIQALIPVEKL